MKHLKTAFIIFILFLLPAGSWYYLTIGRDWRRETMNELGLYGKVLPFRWESLNAGKITQADLEDHNVLLNEIDSEEMFAIMQSVYAQFDNRDDFLFLSLSRSVPDEEMLSTDPAQWWFVSCQQEDCNTFAKAFFKLETQNAALIDKNGDVRHYYNLEKEDDVKKLVRHMAIMIPPKKRERLELRRGNQ